MSKMDTQLAFFLTGAAMTLILLGFAVAVIMPRADRWSKRFFVLFFAVLTLYGRRIRSWSRFRIPEGCWISFTIFRHCLPQP